jgi:hypothetical protein
VTSPVHQAPGQQVIPSPVHQASELPTNPDTGHQIPPKEILQDLPGLPPPADQLQIGFQEDLGRITSLSTSEPEKQQLLLPPSPPPVPAQQQLIVSPSQEISLLDAPAAQQSLIPISQELTLPDAPSNNPIHLPISKEVSFTEAPQLHFGQADIERNYWADSPPNVPGLVKKFENLLVDLEEVPNQWNTERSRTSRSPSSTHNTSSLHSAISYRMSPPGKQPLRPDPDNTPLHRQQAEAGQPRILPTWEPDVRAEAGPSRTFQARQSAWQAEPEPPRPQGPWEPPRQDARADPANFFRPNTTFPTYGGGQYP